MATRVVLFGHSDTAAKGTEAIIRAPEIMGSGGWIGTADPLSLGALRGKVVLLHFWTYSSVNSNRVVEELRALEERYPDELVVVGVHSPKFPREGEPDAVRDAVVRLDIRHPVLDDPDMTTWQMYGVAGWPCVVIVDPRGFVTGAVNGEDNATLLSQVVDDLIAEHLSWRTLDATPVPIETPSAPPGILAYPTKVATDRHGRIVISDSGHDRVLIVELRDDAMIEGTVQGHITHVIQGVHRPQGVRLYGDELVICDTGNDRVGRIDLSSRPAPGEHIDDDPAGILRLRLRHADILTYDLASPWDVIGDLDGSFVVAGAGTHQLWRVTREAGSAAVIAGTGLEGLIDGNASKAELCEPSGLARLPWAVIFADAENSAIRVLTNKGRIGTLAGVGMYDWGYRDGSRRRARLQHPMGVATSYDGSTIFVADTFNSAIRQWVARKLRTIPVEGLNEPQGLDVMPDGRLVVADTNNHRVLFIDPETGASSELALELMRVEQVEDPPDVGETIVAENGKPADVPFKIDLGDLYLDPTEPAPVRIEIEVSPSWLLDVGPTEWHHTESFGDLEVTAGSVGTGTLQVTVTAAACGDGIMTTRRSITRHPLHID